MRIFRLIIIEIQFNRQIYTNEFYKITKQSVEK